MSSLLHVVLFLHDPSKLTRPILFGDLRIRDLCSESNLFVQEFFDCVKRVFVLRRSDVRLPSTPVLTEHTRDIFFHPLDQSSLLATEFRVSLVERLIARVLKLILFILTHRLDLQLLFTLVGFCFFFRCHILLQCFIRVLEGLEILLSPASVRMILGGQKSSRRVQRLALCHVFLEFTLGDIQRQFRFHVCVHHILLRLNDIHALFRVHILLRLNDIHTLFHVCVHHFILLLNSGG